MGLSIDELREKLSTVEQMRFDDDGISCVRVEVEESDDDVRRTDEDMKIQSVEKIISGDKGSLTSFVDSFCEIRDEMNKWKKRGVPKS